MGCYTGQSDPQLRITKEGDAYLCKLLVQGAHRVLSRQSPDTDLRRWGSKLAERGGAQVGNPAASLVGERRSVRTTASRPAPGCGLDFRCSSPSSGDCDSGWNDVPKAGSSVRAKDGSTRFKIKNPNWHRSLIGPVESANGSRAIRRGKKNLS